MKYWYCLKVEYVIAESVLTTISKTSNNLFTCYVSGKTNKGFLGACCVVNLIQMPQLLNLWLSSYHFVVWLLFFRVSSLEESLGIFRV